MRDYWEEVKVNKRVINKKKLILTIVSVVLFITILSLIITYVNNSKFRTWVDRYILGKEITNGNLTSIELADGENYKFYAYNKYIAILKDNNFKIYGNTGKQESSIDLEITNPIFSSNNRYLAIGEEKGQKLYVIEDKSIIWEKKIEGNISNIYINENGYVAVTIVDTVDKTVIAMYDNKGNELFNNHLATTRVVDTTISDDNKYLAFAEIDTSGTLIQSNIKIISIEKGENDPLNAIENTYKAESGNLITSIKYTNKNKLICMYTDKIEVIKIDGTKEILSDNSDKKASFKTINLKNYGIIVEEKSSGLFTADSVVSIINADNKNVATYKANSVTKEIYTASDVLALNLGTEIEFINKNGWLIKKYIAEQEITNVIISNSIAGIIYRDKIEIINL